MEPARRLGERGDGARDPARERRAGPDGREENRERDQEKRRYVGRLDRRLLRLELLVVAPGGRDRVERARLGRTDPGPGRPDGVAGPDEGPVPVRRVRKRFDLDLPAVRFGLAQALREADGVGGIGRERRQRPRLLVGLVHDALLGHVLDGPRANDDLADRGREPPVDGALEKARRREEQEPDRDRRQADVRDEELRLEARA